MQNEMLKHLALSALLFPALSCKDKTDGETALQCCFEVQYWSNTGLKTKSVCNDNPTCPTGNSSETDVCQTWCDQSADGDRWLPQWGPMPSDAKQYGIVDCKVDIEQTQEISGANDDDAGGGTDTCEIAYPPTWDPHGDPAGAFFLATTTGGASQVALTVSDRIERPTSYSVEARFHLDGCHVSMDDTSWCDITFTHLAFQSSSPLTFGFTTIDHAKGFLMNDVSAPIDMTHGRFTLAGTDAAHLSVIWEEGAVEKGRMISNGNATITGRLDLTAPATIVLDANIEQTIAGVQANLTLNDLTLEVIDQPPRADLSLTKAVTVGPRKASGKVEVLLDGRASVDPDDDLQFHFWSVDGVGANEGAIVHVDLEPGHHTVELAVVDHHGSTSFADVGIDVLDADAE